MFYRQFKQAKGIIKFRECFQALISKHLPSYLFSVFSIYGPSNDGVSNSKHNMSNDTMINK